MKDEEKGGALQTAGKTDKEHPRLASNAVFLGI